MQIGNIYISIYIYIGQNNVTFGVGYICPGTSTNVTVTLTYFPLLQSNNLLFVCLNCQKSDTVH